jgi:hypothetical protein
MGTPQNQNELDEIDERLGDLWSMSRKEQDRAGWFLLAAIIGFLAAFICFLYFTGLH